MKQYLAKQLKHLDYLDNCPPGELLQHQYDDPQAIVDEAIRRAASAGIPFDAAKVRSISAARKVLAGILAECKSDSLSVEETARCLGVRPRTIYNACADGSLLSKRVGRQIRIKPADADRFSSSDPAPRDDVDRHSR